MSFDFNEKSKNLLTRASDRISLLYIEYAKIEQSKYGIQIRQGERVSEVPITTIACILLGPGTSITHRAVQNIAQAGCSICWMGSELAVFYAYGHPTTNKSKNLLKQIKYHESKVLHTEVIHKMYNLRYPNDKIKSKTLNELKGYEGKKMKECYKKYAEIYNVNWTGRNYDIHNFEESSLTNKYLTCLNAILYAITQAIIIILGFSPAVGFIHTGHINSFVFDIADLFKEEITIPLAFKLSTENNIFDRNIMITEFRKTITEKKMLDNMVKYLEQLFDMESTISVDLNLWDVFKYSADNNEI